MRNAGRAPARIFTGGPIRTMTTAAGDMPPAVLVADGRVQIMGTVADLRAACDDATQLVDLDGRTLMPGFIDAHAHTVLHGSARAWVDLSSAKGVEDIVRALQTRAQTSDGDVRGYGYDQSKLAELRHPTIADLDRVTTDRQVWIQHASGHGYAVNSKVLADSGITAGTPTPEGGRIDRDAGGHPTGVVFDAACDLLTGPGGVKVANHGPNFHLPMSEAEISRLFDLGQESFLAAGVTTICDAQVTELEMSAYLHARDEGRLQMRSELMALSSKLDEMTGLGLISDLGDDRLRLHGVKLYADGSVIARTAYLGGSHCCHGTPDGYLYHDPEELSGLIRRAHELGLRTATHAQGALPIGVVIDAVEKARSTRPRQNLWHRIEHCGFPTEEQISRMAGANIAPVPQPMQVHEYGDSLIDDFGDFGGRFYPYGSFARNQLPIVVSSDAPVTMPDPLRAAWSTVTRETSRGDVAGGTEQTVDRELALRGVTTAPADLLERRGLGRLSPSGPADFVLVDTDPVTAPLDDLATAKVTETWIGGERVWRA